PIVVRLRRSSIRYRIRALPPVPRTPAGGSPVRSLALARRGAQGAEAGSREGVEDVQLIEGKGTVLAEGWPAAEHSELRKRCGAQRYAVPLTQIFTGLLAPEAGRPRV